MQSLYQTLEKARETKTAVGHFNVSDTAALKAIYDVARELNVPVIIGVSEGEREFIGVTEIVALVQALREKHNFPIFLNADHTHSLEKVREAAEAGFDEILYDGSRLPFEENIRTTQEAVAIIKSINPNIVIEGEVGYIGSSSEIVKDVPPESLVLTTPEEAARFVKETGVDVLAPAVGTMHGLLETMVSGEVEKHLNRERIAEIKEATHVFLTLHGGSGTADADFTAGIAAGLTIIHVNTEIRIAWRRGVEAGLAKDAREVAPYKILPLAVEEISKIVRDRLTLFNGIK